jgi:dUTP pyrophosphatase
MSKKNPRVRGFEVVSAYRGKNVRMPTRKTFGAAGYDIEAGEDATIPPHGLAVVPTGLKAYMEADEYLGIHIRSGIAFKNSLSLINDEGVIDSDYYDNPDNEGHIMIGIINHSPEPVEIKKGDRIAQGIFKKFLKVDGDVSEGSRDGGIGSTGK